MGGYGVVAPQFWIGETGKAMKKFGHEAVVVGLYLMTSPHANMLGLYYVPEIYVAHETGLGIEGASKGLQGCIEAGFCSYDSGSEMVWVHEMARYQVGESLDPKDKRSKGVQNDYDALPANPYLADFFDKYGDAFCMTKKREPKCKPASPFKAPSKGDASQEQDQEQEQEQEQGQGQGQKKAVRASRSEGHKELVAMGVDAQHATDWLKARKAKNLAPTPTAFAQASREAEKLGWSFPEAIAYAAGKGWGGFMAKWVENENDTGFYGQRSGTVQPTQSHPKNKAQVQGEQLDAAAEEFAANMAAKYGTQADPQDGYVPPNDGKTIDME